MSQLQLSEEMAEKNQPSFMQKIKFLCNNSNLTPLTSNTTNEKAFTSWSNNTSTPPSQPINFTVFFINSIDPTCL